MSIWTHIIGIVEINNLALYFQEKTIDEKIKEIENILGEQSYFDFPSDNCKLPLGSEGSLKYKIDTIENLKEKEESKTIIISFVGHLRDFNKEDIENQLKPFVEYIDNQLDVRVLSFSYCTDLGRMKTIIRNKNYR